MLKTDMPRFKYQIVTGVAEEDLKYDAGNIHAHYSGDFIVDHAMRGAEETFSIGQPVYTDEGELIGYLGIGLFGNLDYYLDNLELRVPVEYWKICLPTKHCNAGVHVNTYYQNLKRGKKE